MDVRRTPCLMAVVMAAILSLSLTGCGSRGAGKAGPAESPKLATIPSTTTTTKTTVVTALDGTWEVSYSREDFLAAGADPSEDNPANYGHFTWTFNRGDFEGTASVASGSASGTYVVVGDTLIVTETGGCCAGEVWTVHWSVYRDTLTLTGGPTGWHVKPWRRVGP